MVYTAVYWLNMYPVVNGISKTLSPRSIVTGLFPDYNLHCKEFGSYVQRPEGVTPSEKAAALAYLCFERKNYW